MTKRTRRNHSSIFKAKVALAAVKGDKTLIEIAEHFEVQPTQVTEWKKQLLERASEAFDGGSGSGRGESEADLTLLHAKIGQQALEIDFLGGALTKAGLLSRRVLSWRLSNTLTTDFCIEAVQEAIARYGAPDIFNTDQGSQFTSPDFTKVLKDCAIDISMDGKGCWRDNVFVERLWKSIKYEEVYLHAYDTVSAARSGIGRYLEFYNSRRPHTALDRHTPDEFYFNHLPIFGMAA